MCKNDKMVIFKSITIYFTTFILLLFSLVANGSLIKSIKYSSDSSLRIKDKYIVIFKESINQQQQSISNLIKDHMSWLSSEISFAFNPNSMDNLVEYIDTTYSLPSLQGYSGSFSQELLEKILQRPEVDFIEEDQIVYALKKVHRRKPRKHRRLKMKTTPSLHPEQPEAPWGLARISHRSNKNLSLYRYPTSSGEGVDVYVIDTGINTSHPDFEGRASWGITIPIDDLNIDGNGHGTHCAGTIASKTYGVAKKANVIAVKVLRTNGYGTNSDVLKGVEWTIKEAISRRRSNNRRAVANMSLGGGKSLALERMVNIATQEEGIHFAVAAGNDGVDACEYSPAGAEGPITVGATSREDFITSFSNVGSCVDIFAPGLDITSTWTGGQTKTISGTSMASPHIAGIIALYLGEDDWDPKDLKIQLIEDASEGIIKGLDGGTVNFLANTKRMMKRNLQQ